MARGKLRLLTPLFRYSTTRDAYVLRVVGDEIGPVIRVDRRLVRRRTRSFEGADHRSGRAA
jgi:hypothetical protein